MNVDKAEAVGNAILKEMTGQTLDEYKHRKSRQIVILNAKSSAKNNRRCYRHGPTTTLAATHHSSE